MTCRAAYAQASDPQILVFCLAARSCKKDVKKYCKAEKKSKDGGAILGCLKCAPLLVPLYMGITLKGLSSACLRGLQHQQ